MQIGKTLYIVKTLGGELLQLRYSRQYAENDVFDYFEETGENCVIFEVIVSAVHEFDAAKYKEQKV